MKSYRKTTVLFIALTAGSLPLLGANVDIQWDDPESYSDMDDDGYYSETVFADFSNSFEEMVKRQAGQYLPEDATLSLTMKDVDLAGEYEFWRRSGYDDTRIVKDIYPPRLKFQYSVSDGEGNVVKEGMAQITDLTFLWNIGRLANTTETYFYELELMKDWLRRELGNIEF